MTLNQTSNLILMKLKNKTSVIIVTYNHKDFIEECLKSILIDDDLEIIVVDNNSTDETPEFIEEKFPEVRLIRNSVNSGYGAGNNFGVENSTKDYLVILNPDTKVKPDSIEKLLQPLDKDSEMVTIPKALFYDGEKINTCGNIQHFTGMAFTRGEGEDPLAWNHSRFLNGLSGACFCISRENYLKIGGFDENIFLYMEDSELSWKIASKGLKILYVPLSVIYHNYEFKVTSEKIYHVEKGRYLILRKYLTLKEYFLLSPSLLMTEMLTWGYAVLKGPKGIYYKLRAVFDGFSLNIDKVEVDRRSLLKSMDYEIPDLNFNFSYIFRTFRNVANFIYKFNYKLIK